MSQLLAVETCTFSNQAVFQLMSWLLAPKAHAFRQRTFFYVMVTTTSGAFQFFFQLTRFLILVVHLMTTILSVMLFLVTLSFLLLQILLQFFVCHLNLECLIPSIYVSRKIEDCQILLDSGS